MSTRQLLTEAASRIFETLCDKTMLDRAERGEFPRKLWEALKDNGFHELAMEDSGAELADAYAVMKLAGYFAVPLPLTEAILANRWLANSDRLVSVGSIDGQAITDVPWGREAEVVLGVNSVGGLFLSVPEPFRVERNQNLAGEPRDRIHFEISEPQTTHESKWELLVLGRVLEMAGCLERVLEMSLRYASEREQFGRPIAKFQVIQHTLAVMAGEVAAASRSADAAVDALGSPRFSLELAAAKSRVGEAVGISVEIAHQVHGAMGFTHEHQLHHFTRRLWAWRDEHGNESVWQARLGEHLCELGADQMWSFVAAGN